MRRTGGIDLGGTKIQAVIVDASSKVLAEMVFSPASLSAGAFGVGSEGATRPRFLSVQRSGSPINNLTISWVDLEILQPSARLNFCWSISTNLALQSSRGTRLVGVCRLAA